MDKMKKEGPLYKIEDLPVTKIMEGIDAKFLLSENMLINFIETKAGTHFDFHSHDAEQILIILEGTEDHVLGGVKLNLKAGDICVHPPMVEHGGFTRTGFKGIEIFSPPRKSHVQLMKTLGLVE